MYGAAAVACTAATADHGGCCKYLDCDDMLHPAAAEQCYRSLRDQVVVDVALVAVWHVQIEGVYA